MIAGADRACADAVLARLPGAGYQPLSGVVGFECDRTITGYSGSPFSFDTNFSVLLA
jgi:hypothetical protein